MTTTLFVYGTLRASATGRSHRLLRGARFVRRGSVGGVLYDLGRYPGLARTNGSAGRVFGELYELPDQSAEGMFRALDAYEGSEFARRRVVVTLTDGHRRVAWAYLLRARPSKSAQRVVSGRYKRERGAA